jgi:hypothetical protein
MFNGFVDGLAVMVFRILFPATPVLSPANFTRRFQRYLFDTTL